MPDGSTPHEDEYLLEHDTLRRFMQDVIPLVRGAVSPAAAVAGLRPAFSRLLNDRVWLPDRFRAPCESGGMGGGIGQWLLYRCADRSLTLFSLVVPSGSATPVHDHLAWGLVGLYEGAQEETIYRVVGRRGEGHTELEPAEVRQLKVGDFYDLDIYSRGRKAERLSTFPTPHYCICCRQRLYVQKKFLPLPGQLNTNYGQCKFYGTKLLN